MGESRQAVEKIAFACIFRPNLVGLQYPMASSNRDIAISYLDIEIENCGVSYITKRLRRALKQTSPTTLEFNTFGLDVDPAALTVTLLLDWDACQPEAFSAKDIIEIVNTSRLRRR